MRGREVATPLVDRLVETTGTRTSTMSPLRVDAIALDVGVALVDAERCIGCGACVTGCPSEAVMLERLPEARISPPPTDVPAWGEERLRRRLST